MFSEHLRKIDTIGSRNLFFVAGALVIVCQLVAMAMVADGQVKKAEMRESTLTAQSLAMAQCFETSVRFDRQSCLVQSRAAPAVAQQDVMPVSLASSY